MRVALGARGPWVGAEPNGLWVGAEGSGKWVGTTGNSEAVTAVGKKREVGTNGNRRRGPFPKSESLRRLIIRAGAGKPLAGVFCGGLEVGGVGKIGGVGGSGAEVAVWSRLVSRLGLLEWKRMINATGAVA